MNQLRIIAALTLLCLALSCAGAKKNKAKLLLIINQGKVKVISTGEAGLEQFLDPWQPGAVVLFRTSEITPSGQSGKAGEAYVIDDQKKLRKIGDFDPGKSDDALKEAYTYY